MASIAQTDKHDTIDHLSGMLPAQWHAGKDKQSCAADTALQMH